MEQINEFNLTESKYSHEKFNDSGHEGQQDGMLYSETFAGDSLEGHQRGDGRGPHGHILAAAQEDVGKGAEERTIQTVLGKKTKYEYFCRNTSSCSSTGTRNSTCLFTVFAFLLARLMPQKYCDGTNSRRIIVFATNF